MLKLLIREIDPAEKNGRYLRENLRRIEQFLTDVQAGKTTLININKSLLEIGFNNYEVQYVSFDGQTNFTLSTTPTEPSKVSMSVNGAELRNGVNFSVVGTTVTFDPISAGFILEAVNELGQPDEIVFKFIIPV